MRMRMRMHYSRRHPRNLIPHHFLVRFITDINFEQKYTHTAVRRDPMLQERQHDVVSRHPLCVTKGVKSLAQPRRTMG